MSDANDWENLMNGVFGSGGKLNVGDASKVQKGLADAQKDLEGALERQKDGAEAAGAIDLEANQKALDAALKKQQAEIAAMSGKLTQDLAEDGLLSKQQAKQANVPVLQRFEGVADAMTLTVVGQDDFVQKLVLAFKRPFVMGCEPPAAKNTILICGKEGSGRHLALSTLALELAGHGILNSAEIATMDLGLYPGADREKLFLQDLYAALHAPGQILAFDNYESCHASFLNLLSSLVIKGKAELASRYVVQKGMLVDAGTALVPNAVSSFTPEGKFLVFFSHKGRESLADVFGAPFVNAVGDVCSTGDFTPESLTALAGQQLNALAQKAKGRLEMNLSMDSTVRDYVSAHFSRENGVEGMLSCTEQIFRALSQYKLEQSPAAGVAVALSVQNDALMAAFDKAEPTALLGLLPGAYTGALDDVKAELDNIVGLSTIKEYVLGVADNVQVQQRRKDMGMKTANVSMHMIFTGNPGTGKTTIARILAKYLKAIGALSGGQLVEVSRADLVGRYVGHTAPLTNQVIHSALGGVLFIDEAYSLYRGQDDSFGLECIDTLVKGMEDNRDQLVVVLAGYSREMQEFLTSNSGLASRFPNIIEFPDYTGDELLKILHIQAKSKGYQLESGCDMPLLTYFNRKQAEDAATNGNGRMARNVLEAAILKQSRRLVNAGPEAALDELKIEDFDLQD